MKDFDLDDVFLLSQILDKMELTIEANELAKTIKAEKLESKGDAVKVGKDVFLALGIDVSLKFASNMHKAKKEVVQLISDLSGRTEESVKKMKLKEIQEFFSELIKTEGFADFFN